MVLQSRAEPKRRLKSSHLISSSYSESISVDNNDNNSSLAVGKERLLRF
jgi:hypothetical protein